MEPYEIVLPSGSLKVVVSRGERDAKDSVDIRIHRTNTKGRWFHTKWAIWLPVAQATDLAALILRAAADV